MSSSSTSVPSTSCSVGIPEVVISVVSLVSTAVEVCPVLVPVTILSGGESEEEDDDRVSACWVADEVIGRILEGVVLNMMLS